jgi:hypothetical protein
LTVRVVVLPPPAVIWSRELLGEATGPDGVAIVARVVAPANPVLLTAIRDILELPGYIVRLFGVALTERFRSGGGFL